MENKYFKEALKSMCAGVAYVDSIRHLYDSGLKPEEIQKKCSYPVSIDMVNEVIKEYEEEKAKPESEYEIIQQTDNLGRRSFIRVKKG